MLFSKRLSFKDKPNRLSRMLEKKKASGAQILDLTESNPTRVALRYPENLLAALSGESSLQYRPLPAGSEEAREAVAAYYAEKGKAVAVEDIFLSASTSEAYSWLFKLLMNPGERLLIPRPSYPLFDHLAALESVGLDRYPLRYDGRWRLDPDALENSLTDVTRALACVSPNNPTGSYLKEKEWARLSLLCRRHSMALIVDEVFSDYVLAPEGPPAGNVQIESPLLTTAAGRHDCLNFVLSGFSKVLCLPQMKLGWMLVQGPESERRDACSRLEFIADAFLSINTPVQNAAAEWLAFRREIQAQVLERLRDNFSFLKSHNHNSACNVLDPEGGWYAVLQIPGTLTEEEWVLSLLEEDNVLAHPGYFFEFEREAFLILSLLPQPAVFQTAVQRVLERIARTVKVSL